MKSDIPYFQVKVLWLKNTLGVAVEQVYAQRTLFITPYYFWPRNDAWELIKLDIDSKPWISEITKIKILNDITQIFNSWKEYLDGEKFQDFLNSQKEVKVIAAK